MEKHIQIDRWYGLGKSGEDKSYIDESVKTRHHICHDFAYVLERYGAALEGWLSHHRSFINRQLIDLCRIAETCDPRKFRNKFRRVHGKIRDLLKRTLQISPDRRTIEDEVHFIRL